MGESNDHIENKKDSLSEFMSDFSEGETDDSPISEEEKREIGASSLEESEKLAAILKNRDKDADIWLKKLYGYGILIVLGLWELFVMKVICVQLNPGDLEVKPYSDPVLIALLTSATANILALPMIILNYLFPKKGKE